MSDIALYPMKLAPIFKDKIWGGRQLETLLNKKLPPDQLIGESWELSLYREDITCPLNGPLAGVKLSEIFASRSEELTGRTAAPGEKFPLLTKFVDSSRLLSLQVHPPDSYALEHDNEYGKTECWYVVHAAPGAEIIRGLEPGVTREQLREALESGIVDGLIRRYPARTGDFIFTPAGVVHAICEGSVILEIEQNSDMTYRLWDWGRVAPDGKPRPLHLEKGLEVIEFADTSPDKIEGVSYFEAGNRITHLASCRYFSVELLELSSTCRVDTGGKSFVVLTVVEGGMKVSSGSGEEVTAVKGDTVLLPARPAFSTLIPERGCKVVKAYLDPTHRRFIEPLLRRGVKMKEIERLVFR